MVQVHHDEGVANRIDPESCADTREGIGEALTGERIDGVILVSLKEGHAPTANYVRKLREVLPAAFPSDIFYFQAADMVTQVLNFGLPAQIGLRVVGTDGATNRRVAEELRRRIAAVPGIADVHLQQELDAPDFVAHIH